MLKDTDTGILKYSPVGISDEIRKYLKTIFSGFDEDPGLNFDEGNETLNEDIPVQSRDHEYSTKTHASLPKGGQGQ